MRAGIAVGPIASREPGSPRTPQVRFCVRDVLTPDEYERASSEPVFAILVAYVESLTSVVLPTFAEIARALFFRESALRRRLARVGVSWRELDHRLVAVAALQMRAAGMKMLAIARELGYASPSSLRRCLLRFLRLHRGMPIPKGSAAFESVPLARSKAPRWLRRVLARGSNDAHDDERARDARAEREGVALLDAQRLAEVG